MPKQKKSWIYGIRRNVPPSWQESAARTRSRNSSCAATSGAGAIATLWSRGYRYRKNVRGLPGTPDIVLRKYRVVIFVHGCFWHGHEADSHIPASNHDFWEKKIERNKQRDEHNKEELRKMGWNVITIWECQLKPAVREQTLAEVEYWINHAYLEQFKPQPAKPYTMAGNSPGVAADGRVGYGKRSE